MKLSFIGTSHGVPEPNRRCSCTMITVGSGENAARYYIDMGTSGAMEDLVTKRLPPESVKAIFFTHMHGDHTHGALQFIDLCNWYFKNVKLKVFFPDKEGINAMKYWFGTCNQAIRDGVWLSPSEYIIRDGIDLLECFEGVMYDDGILKITAYRTRHCFTSYAYLVEAEGKRVLFSGDLSPEPENDFPFEAAVRCDLVICENAHFPSEVLERVLRKCDSKRFVINHYSKSRMAGLYDMLTRIKPLNVTLATDGMEIEL